MKGECLFLLCAVAVISSSQTNAADRVDKAADTHCVPEVVYTKTVDFFQLRANQKYSDEKLEVKREPTGDRLLGVPIKDRCLYTIGLYGKDTIAGWLPLWSEILDGPGMLFHDAVWNKQDEQFAISLDEISILPTEHKQLLIEYKSTKAGKTHTSIGVYYFANQTAFFDHLVFSFGDDGDLEYRVQGQNIVISGCWLTCEHKGSVTLSFDRSVQQFAIVGPTSDNQEFYKYIRRSDFPR